MTSRGAGPDRMWEVEQEFREAARWRGLPTPPEPEPVADTTYDDLYRLYKRLLRATNPPRIIR